MSEPSSLDRALAELRSDLHDALPVPDLTTVAGRARARSVRRRMQLGAVAAVVVVSVAVPVLRSMPADSPGAPPAPTGTTTFQLDFADADHGYALRERCPAQASLCEFTLLATTDGGRHWAPRDLPGDDGRYDGAVLTVFGPDALSVVRSVTDEDGTSTRRFSADGGRRWTDDWSITPMQPAVIAPGATLIPVCVGTGSDCVLGVGSTVPDTGSVAPTLTQPLLTEPEPGAAPTAGGRWWAVGRVAETGGWGLAVSSDDGATWATSALAFPGTPTPSGGWHVVEGDGGLYATVQGAVGGGPFGLLAVFRSTDGGGSWDRTWVAGTGSSPADLSGVLGSPVLTSDGRLLVHSLVLGTFESTDGRTFRESAQQLPASVTLTRAGYLVWVREGRYEISTDGVAWREFVVR